MITVLLIICSILALYCWLTARIKVILCELFELIDKGGTEGIQLAKRQRHFNLFFELPFFIFLSAWPAATKFRITQA